MEEITFSINNLWMMVATFLVFLMHLGFASLESGLTRSKNTVNILFKNTMIIAIGLLTYTLVGFNLMYPGEEFAGGFFGFAGFWIGASEADVTAAYNPGYTYWTDFLFQGMFAATAATIVSGAVAERIHLNSFLVFAIIYVAIIYPMVGMWDWGGGWLENGLDTPFVDFAGSTLVHSVGGWAALAAAILLGPRAGKYVDGKIKAIPGHNLPFAVFGVFLLWFGWFGFNGGSVLSADPALVSLVFVTTSLAAAAGAVTAFITSYAMFRTADLTMVLNGILGGLVGITAGADLMSPAEACIIGGIAGVIVVFSIVLFDRIKIDDPVGAISVHLICGIWGTLAVGIFGSAGVIATGSMAQFVTQLIGVTAIGVFCFVSAFAILFLIKLTLGLRVSEEEESRGLDISEHGMRAYPDFQIKG